MHLKELPNIAKRYFGRLLILFTIVALVTAFGSRVVLGPKIPAALVVQRDFIQTIVATGHVESPHRISIGSQIVGVVKNIPVTEGQNVQAGQVLIELDDAEWRAAAQQADMLALQAQARLRQVRELQAPVPAKTSLPSTVTDVWAAMVGFFVSSILRDRTPPVETTLFPCASIVSSFFKSSKLSGFKEEFLDKISILFLSVMTVPWHLRWVVTFAVSIRPSGVIPTGSKISVFTGAQS